MVAPYVAFAEDWAHQTYAVMESVRWANEGCRRFCVSSPTGGGKTLIIQRLCSHWVANGLRVAVMSNRRSLTDQLLASLNNSGIRVGCRAADFESWTDLSAPVQVISAQTEIARVLEKRKDGLDISLMPADLLLVDEGHLQKGPNAIAIIDEYVIKYNAVVISMTATPLGIGKIYRDGLIVAGNNSQLRDCGALVWVNRFEPACLDLKKVYKSKTGTVSQASLEKEARGIWTQHVVANILQTWEKLNPDARPSMGMAPGVKESLWLAQSYWKRGINAAHIDASGIFVNGEYKKTTDTKDRNELFEMVKDGTVKQCWSRFVLREGINIPELYFGQLACPIGDLKSYIQTVGRIMRAHPSKKVAKLADHAGCIARHGSPNDDRDKLWQEYFFTDEDQLTKDRLNDLANPTGNTKESIVCPKCSASREGGSKCPSCGFEHAQSVREIIQESGELKPMTGDIYAKKRVRQESNTESLWLKVYYRMKRAKKPKTFRQAYALFYREHGYYPPMNLPMMPKREKDHGRKINDLTYVELQPINRPYEPRPKPVKSTSQTRELFQDE